MARYDDSQSYTPDYDDDCADCGSEFPRGELAWDGDDLICAKCETGREAETAAMRSASRDLDERDRFGRDCGGQHVD